MESSAHGAAVEALLASVTEGFEGSFTAERGEIHADEGVARVRLRPVNSLAAAVEVVDTGVSMYVSAEGWEADSSDFAREPESDTPGLAWATSVVLAIAEFGMVRVRPTWVPFGRETLLLGSSKELDDIRRTKKTRVLRVWAPWR
jgi:hypothetical protein